jgi:hypothetical protein
MMVFLMSSLVFLLVYNWHLFSRLEDAKRAIEPYSLVFDTERYLDELSAIIHAAQEAYAKTIIPRDMLYDAFPLTYHSFLKEGSTLSEVYEKTKEIRSKLGFNGSGYGLEDGQRINLLAIRLGVTPFPNQLRNHILQLEDQVKRTQIVLNRKLLPFKRKVKSHG